MLTLPQISGMASAMPYPRSSPRPPGSERSAAAAFRPGRAGWPPGRRSPPSARPGRCPAARKRPTSGPTWASSAPMMPGQDVAAAGGGQPRRAVGLAVEVLAGRGHQGGGALEQHGGPGQGRGLPDGAKGGGLHRGPARQLRRRAAPAAPPARRRAGSAPPAGPGRRAGPAARRRRRHGQARTPRRRGPAASCSVSPGPMPEPTSQACTRVSATDPVLQTTSGQDCRTRSATSGGPR